MQYPTDQVLARLRARSKKLRTDGDARVVVAHQQHDRRQASRTARAADARAKLNELIKAVEDDDFATASNISYDTHRAISDVPSDSGPDLASARAFYADADTIDGLVDLIASTGAKHISTGELEKLGALRYVR